MKPQVVIYGLDSRPVNTELVRQIADIGGTFELIFAPAYTRGQELVDWVKANAPEVQEFILSIDAIAYGDLVSSRYYDDIQYASDNLHSTFEPLREAFPNIPITAFNSILRLEPNLSSEAGRKDNNLIREWHINKDLIDNDLIGEERTNAINRNIEIENTVNSELFWNWQKTIERNLTINKKMLSWTDLGYIKKLVFFVDTAHRYGHTSLNRKYLQKKVDSLPSTLGGKVHFVAGEYGTSTLLVGGLQQKYSGNKFLINTGYTNPDLEKEWIDINESLTLHESIVNHAGAIDIKTDFTNDPSGIIFAHTPYSNDDALIKMIQDNLSKAIVIVPSQSAGFLDRLQREVDVTKLLAFCGTGNPSSQIATAMGHAIARLTALKTAKANNNEALATTTHVDVLIKQLANVIYIKKLFTHVNTFASSKGVDIFHLSSIQEELDVFMDKLMRPRAVSLYASKFHHNKVAVDSVVKYNVLGSSFTNIKVPSNHFLEINMKPNSDVRVNVPVSKDYLDVPTTHWAYESVMKLQKLKVFRIEDKFRPDAPILRHELVSTLFSLFKFDTDATYLPNPFSDISTSHPLYKQIVVLKHLGIMDGSSESTFGPDGEMIRAEVAMVLSNLCSLDVTLKGTNVPNYFSDSGVVGSAQQSINRIAHVGIASVPANKLFNPIDTTTRAMVAVFLANVLEKLRTY
ncbi:hypothetical protein [Bacillus phage Nachito]|nr:hypothetical protein [Bacillus phage Nachito]